MGVPGETRGWGDGIGPYNIKRLKGLVLGPILFCIYINDLSDDISSYVCLFDDDTTLYLTTEGADDGLALQKDLDKLVMWEARWDMEFDPSKCQVVLVTGLKKPIKYIYSGFSLSRRRLSRNENLVPVLTLKSNNR